MLGRVERAGFAAAIFTSAPTPTWIQLREGIELVDLVRRSTR